jgi:hypothetical protein
MIDTPSAPGDRDRDTLRAVFAGEGDPSRVDLEVRLSGGAPSERYEFDAKITGSGKVTGRMRDELAGQDQPFARELDAAGRRDLLSRLSQTDLLDGPRLQPPFPPDTVVGQIRARVDGRIVDEWYVLLDPAQVADTAAGEPQPAQQALHLLMTLAE